MNSWITDSDAQELDKQLKAFPSHCNAMLLTFRVMSVGELDEEGDEQLNSDADANADSDDDTNAIPDAEAYH